MQPFIHNVILFGESGAGKSSVVNMIIGSDRAKTSSDPTGCTFRHQDYDAYFDNFSCNIYDTAGLNEGDQGRVPHWKAIRELYTLIRKLDSVTLLICCVRGRIKENTHANWTLFHDVICGGHVPVILVMTGLEQEDDWNTTSRLKRIKDAFGVYGMKPKEVVTVVSIRGLRDEYLDMYTESQTRLRNIISAPRRPWSADKETWFRDIYVRAYSEAFLLGWFGIGTKVEFGRKMGATLQLFAGQTGMKEGDLKKLEDTLLAAERKIAKQEAGFKAKVLEFVKRNLDNPTTADRSIANKSDNEDEPEHLEILGGEQEQGLHAAAGVQPLVVREEKRDREEKGGRSNTLHRRETQSQSFYTQGDNWEKGKQTQATKTRKGFAKMKGLFSSKDKQEKSQKRQTATEGIIPGLPLIRSSSPELEGEMAESWETETTIHRI